MAHIPVQCQNCGARYKIPETFKSDSAKCKGCGTMIDVKSARGAGDHADGDAEKASLAKPRATGGTRKPRQATKATKATRATREGTSKRRRGRADETEPVKSKATTAARGSGRRSRRGTDGDAGAGNEEGGRHYAKKKDNTPMIAAIVTGAMAVVVAVIFLVANPFGGDEETKTAGKNGEAVTTKKAGVAAKPDSAADTQAAEADAKETAAAEKAKAAAAEKKKAAAKKKKALDAAAKKKITKPSQVFKPLSEFKKFDRPASLTEAEAKTVNELLDDLRAGSGLAAIKAPGKLNAMGWKILPLVTNRMLELDYAKAADSEYAYLLANRVLQELGRWEFGFTQSRQADSFDLQDGQDNALRMKNVHQVTHLFWTSDAGWDKYKAKFPKKFQ